MNDFDAIQRALTVWQLCQVQAYFRDRREPKHAKAIRKATLRFIELMADEIGEAALVSAMETVDAYVEGRDLDIEFDDLDAVTLQ